VSAGEAGAARADAAPEAALAAALAHPDVARLAAVLAERPGREADVRPEDPVPRRAAVALVLRVTAPALPPELLFVRRAEWPGDPWSGHVAFPGGRHEAGDASPWHTAARETREETGLDLLGPARLLGTLDELHPRTPVLPPIVVRPHVAVTTATGPLALSDELAAAFWVPVRRFGEPGVDTESTVAVRGRAIRVPSFVHEGHVIWGMTERILRNLLALLG
jgi:8-oxo-dGTP pyrophosphatase MutT (NUDIX family)